MTEKTKKWDDAAVEQLLSICDGTPVSVQAVEKAAEVLGFTTRSVAAKLRSLDKEVASMAKEKVSAFSADEGAELAAFVKANDGKLTYREISEQFAGGKFNPKQVQGKILALELTGSVKATEKVENAKTYSDAEEAKFVNLVGTGAFIEDIATALGKPLNSVRGKALSLLRSGAIQKIPSQKESHAKDSAGDPVDALGADIVNMTVAEIATAVSKTERGVRTILTRRGINVKDYAGLDKKTKAEGKKVAA